jgi:hypothetical protein
MGEYGKQGMVVGRGTFFEAFTKLKLLTDLDFCLLGAAVFLQIGRQ